LQGGLQDGVDERQAEGDGQRAGEVHEGDCRGEVRGVGDDGLEGDEDGGMGDTGAEATSVLSSMLVLYVINGVCVCGCVGKEEGEGLPREDVQRLPKVGVAVPAEHQENVAEGAGEDREEDEAFVATRFLDDDAREQAADGVADDGRHEVGAGFGVGRARRDAEVEGDGEHELL
jgi:hypothetical protein